MSRPARAGEPGRPFTIKITENRGPLGLRVNHAGGEYRIVSPIAGGTAVYSTPDAGKLFDYARRTQLGTLTRDADEFRTLAYTQATESA